jgi:hypothetical protein
MPEYCFQIRHVLLSHPNLFVSYIHSHFFAE